MIVYSFNDLYVNSFLIFVSSLIYFQIVFQFFIVYIHETCIHYLFNILIFRFLCIKI